MEKNTIELKNKLFTYCIKYIDEKIKIETEAIEDAQKSANEETKSSQGDKYETGRAMMQLESEKYATQLAESFKLRKVLNQIDVKKSYSQVQPGCVVATNQGNYFIAISAGEVNINDEKYYTISLVSPLGQALQNKKKGDKINFRNKEFVIQSIE